MYTLISIRSLFGLILGLSFAMSAALAQGQSQSQVQSPKQGQSKNQVQNQLQSQTQQQQQQQQQQRQQLKDEKSSVPLTAIHHRGMPLQVTDVSVIDDDKGATMGEVVDLRVEVTYANSCLVASAEDIVDLRMETETSLDVVLLEAHDMRSEPRICTFIYNPVTVDYLVEDVPVRRGGATLDVSVGGVPLF